MRIPSFRQAAPFLLCYGLAGAGALLCAWLRTPLPWLLGALFFAAAGRLAGLPVRASRRARSAGMLVIGCALGLFFTPATALRLAENAPLVVGGAFLTLALSILLAPVLRRTARLDRPTALFSSIAGGVAEMSILGESYGARPTAIAIVQLLRVVLVVVVVPSSFALLGIAGHLPPLSTSQPFDPAGLVGLLGLGLAGGWTLNRLHVRNPWMLGGMFTSLALTVCGIGLSSVPGWLSALGQIAMGAQLGVQFERAALLGSGRLLAAALGHVALLTGVCVALAMVLAWSFGQDLATLALATAPGGMAEMSLTAKILLLDVPMVVSMHLLRISMTSILVQPFSLLLKRWGYL